MIKVMPAVISATSAAPAFTYEPWLVNVHVFMTPISHVNFNSNAATTTNVYGAYRVSSGAQNDEVDHAVVLAAGTWTFELIYGKNTDAGIISVQFDGVEKGTIDTYNSSVLWNQRTQITSIAVATTAKITVKLKVTSKHASSSAYAARINHFQFKRTA